MTESPSGLCEGCRELKPVAYTDDIGREYCSQCSAELPEPYIFSQYDYLWETIPFHIGDRVECRTAGVLYDGIGTIDRISIDPATFGTPVFPAFHVVIDKKAYPECPDSVWYLEKQLRRVSEKS